MCGNYVAFEITIVIQVAFRFVKNMAMTEDSFNRLQDVIENAGEGDGVQYRNRSSR